MSEWDGRGLPPAAQARVDRAARARVRTSLLSSAGSATLAETGFDPVGEVMGCVVEHIGWAGYGCGAWGWGAQTAYGVAPTQVSGGGGYTGYAPYVKALYYGYEQALHRLLLEAQALGGDGAVGVRWTQQALDETGNREFVAIGTAVRARSSTRPAHLFATDLRGPDVAKLLHAGWAPAGLAIGISVGVRHDDYSTRAQASWSTTNQEVAGYTELVHHVRADARQQFHRRAAGHGGDAAIVSGMGLEVWAVEPGDNHRDHVAEATVIGTSVVRFADAGRAVSRSSAVLPLRPMSTTRSAR